MGVRYKREQGSNDSDFIFVNDEAERLATPLDYTKPLFEQDSICWYESIISPLDTPIEEQSFLGGYSLSNPSRWTKSGWSNQPDGIRMETRLSDSNGLIKYRHENFTQDEAVYEFNLSGSRWSSFRIGDINGGGQYYSFSMSADLITANNRSSGQSVGVVGSGFGMSQAGQDYRISIKKEADQVTIQIFINGDLKGTIVDTDYENQTFDLGSFDILSDAQGRESGSPSYVYFENFNFFGGNAQWSKIESSNTRELLFVRFDRKGSDGDFTIPNTSTAVNCSNTTYSRGAENVTPSLCSFKTPNDGKRRVLTSRVFLSGSNFDGDTEFSLEVNGVVVETISYRSGPSVDKEFSGFFSEFKVNPNTQVRVLWNHSGGSGDVIEDDSGGSTLRTMLAVEFEEKIITTTL